MCLAGLLSLLSLHSTHLIISFILPTGTACSSSYSNQEIRPALLPTSTLTSLTMIWNGRLLSLLTHLITLLFSWRSLRSQLSLQLSLYLNPNRICQSLTTLEDTGLKHSSIAMLGYPHPPQLTYLCYHLSLYAHGSSRVPLRGSICKREEREQCLVER